MMIALDVFVIALAGLMVGTEVAVALFFHPVLWRMEERTHAQTASALAGVMGMIMPVWYGLTLLLTLTAIWEHRNLDFDRGPGPFLVGAAVGWFCCILFTMFRLLPLNRKLGKMDPDRPHREWLKDRSRWDGLHRWRVVLLLVSLSLLGAGVLGIWRDYVPVRHVGSFQSASLGGESLTR